MQMKALQLLKTVGAALLVASGAMAQVAQPLAPEAKRSHADLPESFNPSRCKHGDKRYVYWAAGDQVFRFKFDPAVPLRSTAESELTGVRLNAKREVPPAPDPTETEGCYRNPLRAGVVPYMDKFDAQLFQSIVGRKLQTSFWAIRELQAVPKNWDASLNLGQLHWQRVQHTCWMRAPGFHECLLSSGTSRTDFSVSHLFKIEAKNLPTYPQSNDIFFVLRNDAASGHLPNGKEAYSVMQIYGGVRLGIGFRLFPEEIDFMVPYFSGLINYVVQAHLPDYKWVSANPGVDLFSMS